MTHIIPQIELRNIFKSYHEESREHPVLSGINLTVAQGEFLILLGRSGSGKSTVLNLIAGIDLPNSGEVILADQIMNDLTETERTLFRRKNIGFIFQFFNLIPTLNVLENICLPLELNGILTPENLAKAQQVLDNLHLGHRSQSYPDRLSGGEQQRVAIARALIHDPQVILADEPTGNLDLETGREVLALMDNIIRSAGKTLIMVTHSQEVVGQADRILTLSKGQISEVSA